MRILVCGGSHADVPQIRAAQRLGHWVATTGRYPHELGHRFSDAYFPADYSDVSAVKSVVFDNFIDAIVPSCNDWSYLTCAAIAPLLGQSGFDDSDTARKIHDKDAFRAVCKRLDIPIPRVLASGSLADNLPISLSIDTIIKPVDLSGGKGITRLSAGSCSSNAVKFAVQQSKAKRVVVEEFVRGSNHGLSAIVISGKVCFSFVDDEHYFGNPFLVSGASWPGRVRPEVTAGLVSNIEKLVSYLKLVDGLVHCQFIQTATGYRLLEICRRPPGDLYTRFVELATGVAYPAVLVELYLGQKLVGVEPQLEPPLRYVTRHCVMSQKNGRFKGLSIDPRLDGHVFESLKLLEIGDSITDAGLQKVAILFVANLISKGISGEELPSYVNVITE